MKSVNKGKYWMKKFICSLISAISFNCVAVELNRFDIVAEKYKQSSLDRKTIENAKMQGECLVQIKDLTFKKKDKFDPISEWVNYRSVSLLEKYSPCETLIMLEVANKQIRAQKSQ